GAFFRESLLKVGELRSLLPEKCNAMALTATASLCLRLKLKEIIEMRNPTVVLLPPCKHNILYQRTNYRRAVIYCRTIEECATLYRYFRDNMGRNFTEPQNAPAIARFRMVDMFTSCVDDEIKSHIIHSFPQLSCLRILCATVAL
uniref:Helicase ATP-binding domain-containing protein n=1 Tax=Amphimedon queenslandica TaxID=400682 RepID=A0A1X7VD72_AMPQE